MVRRPPYQQHSQHSNRLLWHTVRAQSSKNGLASPVSCPANAGKVLLAEELLYEARWPLEYQLQNRECRPQFLRPVAQTSNQGYVTTGYSPGSSGLCSDPQLRSTV